MLDDWRINRARAYPAVHGPERPPCADSAPAFNVFAKSADLASQIPVGGAQWTAQGDEIANASELMGDSGRLDLAVGGDHSVEAFDRLETRALERPA
jgi:hypothetical protein